VVIPGVKIRTALGHTFTALKEHLNLKVNVEGSRCGGDRW
jgi:hypothetical protein